MKRAPSFGYGKKTDLPLKGLNNPSPIEYNNVLSIENKMIKKLGRKINF
jgi:hypothetical protein